MKEAERRSLAAVRHGLSGECFIVSMHEIKLTEYVRVIARYARYFEYDDAKFELRAQF